MVDFNTQRMNVASLDHLKGDRRLKILYVDVHLHYLNPTNTLMPNMMNYVGDVTFYGPGYVSDDDLTAGVERFIDKTGRYDIIVLGPNLPFLSVSDQEVHDSVGFIGKYSSLSPPKEKIYAFFSDFLKCLRDISIPHRFASLIAFDYYSSTQAQMDCLDSFKLKIIASNEHFAKRVSDLPNWAHQEKHFRANQHLLCDAWYDYLSSRPERVITALHFISEAEFSFRGLSGRGTAVSIPGVDYLKRREAVSSLRKNGIKVSGKSTYNLYRTLNKIGIHVYSNHLLLKYFNVSFFADLINSKYVYTAAEGFGLPIRKYFEIPAAGAVLLATSCNGFDRIGFKNGVNCVQVSPEDLTAAVQYLEKNPEGAQKLAIAGRQLIFENHSIVARASQVKSCILAILAGQYTGSEWVDGSFRIKVLAAKNESAQPQNNFA